MYYFKFIFINKLIWIFKLLFTMYSMCSYCRKFHNINMNFVERINAKRFHISYDLYVISEEHPKFVPKPPNNSPKFAPSPRRKFLKEK